MASRTLAAPDQPLQEPAPPCDDRVNQFLCHYFQRRGGPKVSINRHSTTCEIVRNLSSTAYLLIARSLQHGIFTLPELQSYPQSFIIKALLQLKVWKKGEPPRGDRIEKLKE